jgi:hypothetical protein
MSFREKSAWISLLSIGGIYGVYFGKILYAGHGAGSTSGLLGTIILLVGVQVTLTALVAIRTPREAKAPRDERERLIDLRATRFAYCGLATGIAFACFFGAFDPPVVFNTNALLFILVVTEMMRSGSQIAQYRRGA